MCFNLNKIERTNYRAGKMWEYFVSPLVASGMDQTALRYRHDRACASRVSSRLQMISVLPSKAKLWKPVLASGLIHCAAAAAWAPAGSLPATLRWEQGKLSWLRGSLQALLLWLRGAGHNPCSCSHPRATAGINHCCFGLLSILHVRSSSLECS